MSQFSPSSNYQQPTSYGSGSPLAKATDERNLGTIAHVTPLVLMLISGGLAGFIGSLVVYLYAKDRGSFARAYAASALNVQITVCIASAISWVLMFVLIGFVTLPLVLLFGVVVHAIGAIKANQGERFDPPLTMKFVS